jgi:hypothetical protein
MPKREDKKARKFGSTQRGRGKGEMEGGNEMRTASKGRQIVT